MSRFRLEDYKGKFVMHVKTEEEYDTFSKFLDRKGETWNIDMSYMEIRHWHEHTNNTCFCFNEGMYCNLEYFKNHDYAILEFSDFDWEKKEMKEFKVGDWVKWNGIKKDSECCYSFTSQMEYLLNNKELHKIDKINDRGVYLQGCGDYIFSPKWLEKVETCEFTKGQEVEVSGEGKFYNNNWGKFYEYKSDLKMPFLVIDKNGDITNWQYCRAIQHKYEPYTEFDPTWIGKDICYDGEFIWTIVGRQKDGEVVLYNDEDEYTEQTFSQLFEYTWEETGKPFGKEIK